MFQCHKCRSINYDEKDPFLCNACGFCKYAKFEYTLTTRACCAVDPIENEDDRKKAIFNINSLLDKADKVYKQLILNKPVLESWIMKISESGLGFENESTINSAAANGVAAGGSQVNQYIQQLALRYCGDCKNSFEELSKIIQKVMATRKELVTFDASRKGKVPLSAKGVATHSDATGPSNMKGKELVGMNNTGSIRRQSSRCFGCASASVEHCLTLLRALATKPDSREELYQQGLIQQLMEYNLRRGTTAMRHEVRKLICLLTCDNPEATDHLNSLLSDKVEMALKGQARGHLDLDESVRHDMTLLAVTLAREDTCWERRLKCVLKLFLLSTRGGGETDLRQSGGWAVHLSPSVMENITLPCLKILHDLAKPVGPSTKSKQFLGALPPPPSKSKGSKHQPFCRDISWLSKEGTSSNDMGTSLFGEGIDVERWISGDPDYSFSVWEQRNFNKKILPDRSKAAIVPSKAKGLGVEPAEMKPRRSSSPSITSEHLVGGSHKIETAIMETIGMYQNILVLSRAFYQHPGR